MSLTPSRIPLFPLDVVLFPGMVLPLHIFEPRYRKMVQDCVAAEQPFGLLWAEGELLTLARERPVVGTTATITAVEPLEGGRYNISTVGSQRFQVRDVFHEEPYLIGQIEPYPFPDAENPALAQLRPELVRMLHRYVVLLDQIASNDITLDEIPESDEMLAFVVAVYYQCQNWRKQELLATDSLAALMEKEIAWLRTELPIIEQTLRFQERGQLPPLISSALATYGLN